MHITDKYTWLKHLDFMIVELLSMLVAFVIAFMIKFNSFDLLLSTVWIRLICLILVLNLLAAVLINPYKGIFKRPYYMEIIRGFQLTLFNMITTALILYVFKVGATYSRAVFIMTYVFYFFISLLFKYIWKVIVIKSGIGHRKSRSVSIFVFSDRDRIREVLINVSAGDFDPYEIRGICFTDGGGGSEYESIPVVNTGYIEYIIQNNINDVLVASAPINISNEDYKSLIDNAVNIHVNVESVIGMQTEDQFVADVGVYKTLSAGAFSFSPGQVLYLIIKRLLEIVIGIVGVVLLLPVSLVVKLVYLICGDHENIFFRQDRVGLNGKPIRILKFRTMVVNADEMLEDILSDEKYRKEWETNQKITGDPRITKAGRVLRRLSLDEFPQIVNVLFGSMSIVGPRPLVQGELEAHDGLKLYQRVKPGITGWWGCNGRSNIEYRERLELEYYYIRNFSMYLDILCILRTIVQVIRGSGAE